MGDGATKTYKAPFETDEVDGRAHRSRLRSWADINAVYIRIAGQL